MKEIVYNCKLKVLIRRGLFERADRIVSSLLSHSLKPPIVSVCYLSLLYSWQRLWAIRSESFVLNGSPRGQDGPIAGLAALIPRKKKSVE